MKKARKRALPEIMKDLRGLIIEMIESDHTDCAINPITGQEEFLFRSENPTWPRLPKREALARAKQARWPGT